MSRTIARAINWVTRTLPAKPSATPAPTRMPASLVKTIQLTDLLVGLLEYHDPFFRGGSSLTGLVAVELGRELSLDPGQLEELALAALLRDIGRLALRGKLVPRNRAELEAHDRRLVERHVGLGLDLLEGVELPSGVRAAIRHHHERWDGNGYPARLRGRTIPMSARVLAVADSFSAMIRPRPYRPPLRVPSALDELRRQSGQAYDPAVVEALVRMLGRADRPVLSASPGHHVLVVHSDDLRATAVAAWLCQHGFLTEVAADAHAAKERILRVPVAAVIVDAHAAGVIGLVRDLRDVRSGNIILVGMDSTDVETRETLLLAGADVCLRKQASLNDLRSALSLLVRSADPGWSQETIDALVDGTPGDQALQGKIAEFPLTWLLQALKYDGRTALVVVKTPTDEGHIHINRGDPWHATTQSSSAETALREILRWQDGSFAVRLGVAPTERTIKGSLMTYLLDEAVALDHQDIFGAVLPG